jgi:tRNA threonylcarbamoyladenosine biosynthesis protein TsaE
LATDSHILKPPIGGAKVVVSSSEQTTQLLGRAIGESLRSGDVVLLTGELGAGKTCMVHGMAAGIGSTAPARSPTFVLVNEYQGRIKLSHADLYRVDNPMEARELALDESLQGGALVVEWPERAAGELPEDRLLLQIEVDPATEIRTIVITPFGQRASRLATRASATFDILEAAIP